MALKYYLEYTTRSIKPDNTEDVVINKCEIYNDDFTGEATEITGYCILTKASTKDVLQAIRGGGLKIVLDANIDLDFTDLYSEEERTFYVKYYKNSELEGLYWLDPEGLFQDFVSDKWQISLNCTDGLGVIKNLQYIDNTTEELFSGKQSQLEVIVNCLKRTGFQQNIYIKTDLFYENLSLSENSVANTNVDSFRYVKDDNTTTMQCIEVLNTILELHSLIITQRKGSWFIVKPNMLYDNSEIEFFAYDYEGTALNPNTLTVNFSQNLGSQKDSYYPFHANANQQISIYNSIGAYRINYNYGLTNHLFENIYLENVNGVINEWTINDSNKLTFPSDNKGFLIESIDNNATDILVLTSKNTSVTSGDLLKYSGKITYVFPEWRNLGATRTSRFKCRVVLVGGANYYLNKNGTWNNSPVFIEFIISEGSLYSYEINMDNMPESGDIKIELFSPENNVANNPFVSNYLVTENTLLNQDALGDVKGETHTFQRINNKSSKISENKEVLNGDLPSELYSGTLYKNDESTPTDYWFKNTTNVRFLPILQWMGEDRMNMYSKPFKLFKGDTLGYIDYLSVLNINNINGKFLPIEWSYNTKTNITKLKSKEIFNIQSKSPSEIDLEYTVEFDYGGETEEPTIKS